MPESLGYYAVVFVILGLAILMELRLVTDGRTEDGQTHDDDKYRASIASTRVGKNRPLNNHNSDGALYRTHLKYQQYGRQRNVDSRNYRSY